MSVNKTRLKREAQGAFCVLNTNTKSQKQKSMKINVICTVRTTECSMRTRPIKNPISVKQWYPNATEQQGIHSNARNNWSRCARPLFSSDSPRRKPTGQIRRLHQWRNVMSPSHMIDAVLRCTFPDNTPRHRAPLQLCQLRIRRYVYPDSAGCACHRSYKLRTVWSQTAPGIP